MRERKGTVGLRRMGWEKNEEREGKGGRKGRREKKWREKGNGEMVKEK